jgi:hypothetical protein
MLTWAQSDIRRNAALDGRELFHRQRICDRRQLHRAIAAGHH